MQPKIVLAREGVGWHQALGGYPSTHILKPRLAARPTVIFDEEYGARLARRLGLAAFDTRIDEFDGLPTLVIERFDRVGGARVHQEDFNQALGASGNQKYQELGGVVSLARVADAVSRYAASADLVRLARLTVLAVGIGNLDMHTKNIGMLHPADDAPSLAPAYDQVPLAHLPGLNGRLALAVNRKYRLAEVTRDDLVAEFESWRLRRAGAVVAETLDQLSAAVDDETPHDLAHPDLHRVIRGLVDNLLGGRGAGA
ncbi:type II toxin-antitoxin system HipA family toxin [Agromyces mangrovi Wang et al. 2018]|uniref:type II toxin-antitoxin system HipA family toxin n=1 Tax=Agromyces mangrovi TaxID=1858653 RepID=UPI0025723453|nr:HipA domain-containing protein [Agromyces mangrovi]